jgi:hypothetical protein
VPLTEGLEGLTGGISGFAEHSDLVSTTGISLNRREINSEGEKDMGRYAESLINAPPLPVIENHVEILIAESRLAYRAANEPDVVEEEQLMMVLVSFDPEPAQRRSARALTETFIAAQATFEQLPAGRELDHWLGNLLNGRAPASLCVVFSLPATYSMKTANQIQAVIAGLRNGQHHHLGLAVAVSVEPEDWADCGGIDGFVVASAEQKDRSALKMFNLLSPLMAPGLSAALDAEDFRAVFGTPESPSEVVSGIWLETDEIFILATEEDKHLVKNSQALAFMPGRPLSISSLNELLQALRKFAADDSEIVMIAPYGLSSMQLLVDQIVPIFMIAAPVANSRTT